MTTSETGEVKNESIIEDEVQIKKILVPLDGSNCSIRSAEYAIEVARLQKAQIFCVHVINKIPYSYSLLGPLLKNILKMLRIRLNAWFTQVIDMAKKEATDKNSNILDIKIDIIRGLDSVTDAIITYATINKIDLIMMGTKGRTGLKRFLIGSVA